MLVLFSEDLLTESTLVVLVTSTSAGIETSVYRYNEEVWIRSQPVSDEAPRDIEAVQLSSFVFDGLVQVISESDCEHNER